MFLIFFKRIYAGLFELEKYPDESTREICYIAGANGITAMIINEDIFYLRRDHQGSVTALVDVNGNIVEEYSYDAWGRRRTADTWEYYTTPQTTLTSRGYTFHEHLDEFDLINMNGRAYDPVVGRFLSADILVQNPERTQGYNRYSYCLNNPLKYTDPSGYYPNADQILYRMQWNSIFSWASWFASDPSKENWTDRIRRNTDNTADNNGANAIGTAMSGGGGGGNPLEPFNPNVKGARPASEVKHSEYYSHLYGTQEFALEYIKWRCVETKVEQGVMILEDGFLVLPTYNNNADGRYNTSFFSYFPTEWDNGKLYVTYKEKRSEVLGLLHTHIFEEEYASISDPDKDFVRYGRLGNVPLLLYDKNEFTGIHIGSKIKEYRFFKDIQPNMNAIISGDFPLINRLQSYYNNGY